MFRAIDPCTMLAPVPPVLVSCKGRSGPPNVLTVAWTGVVCSKPPMVSISLKECRYSYELIRETGEFVINMAGAGLCRAVDYCGVKSGRDTDKLKDMGLTAIPAPPLDFAPAIAQCPLHIACRVRQELPLGSHHMLLAEVVGVYVKDELFDEKGGLHLERADLLCYSHGIYQRASDVLGFFGFSVANEKVLKKRMAQYQKTAPKK